MGLVNRLGLQVFSAVLLSTALFSGAACEGGSTEPVATTEPAATVDDARYPIVVRGNSFPDGPGFLDEDLPLRDIEIAERPERIVVVGPPLYVEILSAVGAIDRLVGVSDSPNNPPETEKVPKVGTSMEWSIERVLVLKPDLVLGASRWGKRLERDFGLTSLTCGRPGGTIRDVGDVLATIRSVDLAVNGSTTRSDPLVASIKNDIANLQKELAGRRKLSIAVVYAPPQYDPSIAGTETPEHEMILAIGGKNAFTERSGYETVSLEALLVLDPAYIITDEEQVERLTGDPRLAGLRAVRTKRVFGMRTSRLVSPGVVTELRSLADRLHGVEVSRDD